MNASITFIGNATTLLRLGQFTLLTDPAFGPAGSRVYLGYGAWTKRLRDPVLDALQGAAIDGMVLSHLHGDHFDAAARKWIEPTLPILTTPAASRKLRRKRYLAVRGLPTWECFEWSRDRQRLRVTAVPGKHGPGLVDRLLPDVMGSVVELEVDGRLALRLYITGDTLVHDALEQIPRRFGEMDAMLIHLGGTRLAGMLLTMDDRQGVDVAQLIRPALTVPIHFDDYQVMKSPLADFVTRAERQGLTGITPIERGGTLHLPLRDGIDGGHAEQRNAM
ncbi:MBL fold metallo-hydrolase [Actinoplanes sp. Pm04-4]|jgi:L-ascorbate metabolism protein UlaG (beta-lactamase superfamily)|uniref:MBL fold metallo-hydrolase n=1 Tax=Paractinoplanes pyxinae TaxID=2997416 RepID=A0ABT4B509_9ACTN|nr:MBL fold metallo-hydrolase [Actinoplanes pyxinae]MCY1140965.1 MBL fold metallo-hydrolase [Actinoplanes pyxinae]